MSKYTNEYFENLYKEVSDYLVSHGFNSLPEIRIRISERMHYSTLGRACGTWSGGKIVPTEIILNSKFLLSQVSEQEIIEVFFHECSHIYCYAYYAETGHTPLFNRICKSLGATGGKFKQSAEVVDKYMSNREEAAKSFLDRDSFTAKDIHAMRCSFKMIARKYNLPLSEETFNTYVRPRYKYIFTESQIDSALTIILN